MMVRHNQRSYGAIRLRLLTPYEMITQGNGVTKKNIRAVSSPRESRSAAKQLIWNSNAPKKIKDHHNQRSYGAIRLRLLTPYEKITQGSGVSKKNIRAVSRV
jgi:hypothetical protein